MVQEWVSTGTAPVPHLSGPAAGPFVSEQSRLEHQSGTSEHCQSPGARGPPRAAPDTPWLSQGAEEVGERRMASGRTRVRKQASRPKWHVSWWMTVVANAYWVPQALVSSFLNLATLELTFIPIYR